MDRKALSGATGAAIVGGGAQAAPSAPEAPQEGTYRRSDGQVVPMAAMNPYHRAAAARKAAAAGDAKLAEALRASGPLPE